MTWRRLPRLRWRHAVLATGFAVLGAIGLASAPVVTDTSSQGVGLQGTAAAYDWLTTLGYATHRITGTFTTDGVDTLVIESPSREFSTSQANQVRDFASGGGTVIVAVASPVFVRPLLADVDVGIRAFGTAKESRPVSDPLSAKVTTVSTEEPIVWAPPPGSEIFLASDDGPTGVRVHVGSGSMWFIGSSRPFTNDGLREADNARMVLYLAEQSRGGRIGFDDVHHEASVSDPQAVIFQSPLGLGLLIALAAALVGIASSGRRIGRPVPAGDPGRVPTAADYVVSMAQMFQRSSDRGSVATRCAETLKTSLGRRTGVDPRLADDAFGNALTQIDPVVGEAALAVLVRARDLATAAPRDADLVDLAQRGVAAEALLTRVVVESG